MGTHYRKYVTGNKSDLSGGKVGLASGRVARSRAAKPAPHADFADKS